MVGPTSSSDGSPDLPAFTADPAELLRVPRATYRLQLGPDLTFDDAARLVPYLAALDISDCYISPFSKPRTSSSRRSSGCPGTTRHDSWSRSGTFHRSSTRTITIGTKRLTPWWRESTNQVSERPGAVQETTTTTMVRQIVDTERPLTRDPGNRS